MIIWPPWHCLEQWWRAQSPGAWIQYQICLLAKDGILIPSLILTSEDGYEDQHNKAHKTFNMGSGTYSQVLLLQLTTRNHLWDHFPWRRNVPQRTPLPLPPFLDPWLYWIFLHICIFCHRIAPLCWFCWFCCLSAHLGHEHVEVQDVTFKLVHSFTVYHSLSISCMRGGGGGCH